MLTACGIETPAYRGVYTRQRFCCNSAYRLRYWNILNYLKHDVRTLLLLQQCLPLAVLKLAAILDAKITLFLSCNSAYRLRYWNNLWFAINQIILYMLQQCLPLAVLKHCRCTAIVHTEYAVATVLTACGIETSSRYDEAAGVIRLQQCLPLAVLKPDLAIR